MSDNSVSNYESESSQNTDSPKKRKRGQRHPEKYIRNVNKNKKLKGLEYRTLKCFERLSIDDGLQMLTRFRSHDTKNEQDICAQSFIEAQPVKRNRSIIDLDCSRSKAKSVTFKYYGNKNGKRVEVCKNALCQILTVTRGEINRLCALQSLNQIP
ncbi:hypothetical protein ABEB36_012771 [Hypothenemus hampei]|uniref:Uncharacterized protein n=1 Tax=Hypothenemus hampei TaxID=57062 RepID=A0ABD1ECP1_HYPHA